MSDEDRQKLRDYRKYKYYIISPEDIKKYMKEYKKKKKTLLCMLLVLCFLLHSNTYSSGIWSGATIYYFWWQNIYIQTKILF